MAERLYRANVLVCGGTGCVSSGSLDVMSVLSRELKNRGLEDEVKLVQTGCRGFCAMGPVMIIYPEGIFYCQVQAADVPLIVEETLIKGRLVAAAALQGARDSPGRALLPRHSVLQEAEAHRAAATAA